MTRNLNNPPIEGVYTAIVTPFHNGQVDEKSFARLCELQAEAGVDGLVIAGTTGESPTLTFDEKIALTKLAASLVGKNMKIMGGSGSNNTEESIRLSLAMAEAGADSLLVVTPPYNKPSLQGLQLHYRSIAESCQLPICLYHVPGRTGQKLTADQLATLCAQPAITAVKEASADLILFSEAAQKSSANYLSGDDFTFLPSLAIGGKGVISVLTNVFPKAFVKMTQLFQNGHHQTALAIHNAVFAFTNSLFIESNPCPTKYILSKAGLCHNELRAPLCEVTKESAKIIDAAYDTALRRLQELGV